MNSRLTNLTAQARVPTPLGEMTMATTERGVAGLWFDDQAHHPGTLTVCSDANHPHLLQMRRWLDDFWQQGVSDLTVPLDLLGTAFQQQVWQALLTLVPGTTSTYGALAERVGSPRASRAVGAAVGRNPVSILVPCHRVVGQDGTLTGYAGGLPRKQFLLALEARTQPTKASLF